MRWLRRVIRRFVVQRQPLSRPLSEAELAKHENHVHVSVHRWDKAHAPVYVPSHYDNRHRDSALERAVRGMKDQEGEGSGDGPT